MSSPSDLLRLAHDVTRTGTLEGFFLSAQAQGHSLAAAVDVLWWDLGWFEVEGDDECRFAGDPVQALVNVTGSESAAQQVLDSSSRHAQIQVAAYLVEYRALLAVHQGFADHIPASELLLRTRALRCPESALAQLVDVYALHELVQLHELTQAELGALCKLLTRRCSALDALHTLRSSGLPEHAIVSSLQRFWNIQRSQESEPWRALLDTHARMLEDACIPVRQAIPKLAEARAPEAWLPILRTRGLTASAAALHLAELAPERGLVSHAQLLQQAGYSDDDVLRALLENGLPRSHALSLLREQGWDLPRLVATLIARRELLPQVRRQLEAWGVGRSLQRELLAAHAEGELLALVMRDEPA